MALFLERELYPYAEEEIKEFFPRIYYVISSKLERDEVKGNYEISAKEKHKME